MNDANEHLAECRHCDQPIHLVDGEWKHREHGSWFNRCQRTANYGTDAEPKGGTA